MKFDATAIVASAATALQPHARRHGRINSFMKSIALASDMQKLPRDNSIKRYIIVYITKMLKFECFSP
ncbi:MAG: hypothetical protein ACJA2Q_002052 [Pseudohongiellaceae bacterium]|jgi:hypothetical protein